MLCPQLHQEDDEGKPGYWYTRKSDNEELFLPLNVKMEKLLNEMDRLRGLQVRDLRLQFEDVALEVRKHLVKTALVFHLPHPPLELNVHL